MLTVPSGQRSHRDNVSTPSPAWCDKSRRNLGFWCVFQITLSESLLTVPSEAVVDLFLDVVVTLGVPQIEDSQAHEAGAAELVDQILLVSSTIAVHLVWVLTYIYSVSLSPLSNLLSPSQASD